ncbi:MAG: tRNA (adenosine(37)-N6)-threonylcarbamoyltransferase complex dimerization subunit type 1 TsaB [Mesorhizobium sp.]
MIVLAIDTASTLCAVCLWDAAQSRELGRAVEDIGKGHAERLMELIERALGEAGIGYDKVGVIAVSVGPGSFTGIRVGVSAARGLALALGIPAHGVTTLSAIAEAVRAKTSGRRIVAAIDAKRDELYAADHARDGSVTAGPMIVRYDAAASLAAGEPPVLAGSGAAIIADRIEQAGGERPAILDDHATTADIAIYAALAAAGKSANSPPKPLYLRAPDARPQGGFALPRTDA